MDDDTLLIVALTGRTDNINLSDLERKYMSEEENQSGDFNFNDLFKGRCFLKYKNDELEKLESEIKELYNKVKSDPNNKIDLGFVDSNNDNDE
jgi:hypothetical protein